MKKAFLLRKENPNRTSFSATFIRSGKNNTKLLVADVTQHPPLALSAYGGGKYPHVHCIFVIYAGYLIPRRFAKTNVRILKLL